MSLDETLADRGIGAPWTATRVLARAIDRLAFRLADLVVVDTAAHARRFAATCGLHPSKVVVAPVGARDPAGLSTPGKTAGPSAPLSTSGLHVLYFGGFIPLHGVPVVLDAARHLAGEEGVRFELVGDGQDAELAERQVGAWGLDRVQVRRTWMPEAELVQRHVRVADVCLGIFADRPKTMDVVPAKLYLALACGCPVVTADTPAVREEILAHAPPAEPPVLLCPPGDGRALARALLRLRDDPELRAALARRGRALYERRFTPACIAADLARAIEAFHGRSSAPR
ncbi:MAG TPA: glycosyltransferase [bacterium]|nr:glycosyltransferase [bacterium]